MKKRTIKFIAVGLLLVGAVTIPYIVHRIDQSRIDGQHIFEVAAQPRFLTEELALTKARETLKREGCSSGDWQPQLARITTAPDGRIDEFMSRDTGTTNRGLIHFRTTSGYARDVRVELEGNRLICHTWETK